MADPTTEGQTTTATPASDAAAPASAPASQAAPANTPADASATPPAEGQTDANAKPNGEDAKPGDKPADAPKAPDTYEFKLPDGVKLEAASLEELSGLAKELGLTQEQAQKVADLGAKQAQTFASLLAEQQKTAATEWAGATQADKEIGGDKLPENLSVAKKALDSFGTPELKKLLNESGLGNHPEVVRLFVRAGKAISEDGRLVTGSAGQKDRSATPIENRLYPNQK